jgi:hypothetical protein
MTSMFCVSSNSIFNFGFICGVSLSATADRCAFVFYKSPNKISNALSELIAYYTKKPRNSDRRVNIHVPVEYSKCRCLPVGPISILCG